MDVEESDDGFDSDAFEDEEEEELKVEEERELPGLWDIDKEKLLRSERLFTSRIQRYSKRTEQESAAGSISKPENSLLVLGKQMLTLVVVVFIAILAILWADEILQSEQLLHQQFFV